ncbi:hypothetical protein HK104_010898 [Borealophlyctis nickersoniae]|nr:hypothetical protein HK104_010898 [Borealophlyctis nickersoniae]
MDDKLVNLYNPIRYAPCLWQSASTDQYFKQIRSTNARLVEYFKQIRSTNARLLELNEPLQRLVQDSFVWFASMAIYASNLIEDTGLNENDTKVLVSHILRSRSIDGILAELNAETPNVRDVVQHAKAFKYLCIEKRDEALSEGLILETHRILMDGCEREDGLIIDAGSYRSGDVTVGRGGQPCVSASKVRARIKEIVETFNNQRGKEDPFALASQLKHSFVHVHPFDDGNGRLSRLLLNWALLAQGLPFPITLQIGFRKRARRNYMGCIAKANPSLLCSLVLESVNAILSSFFERARFVVPCAVARHRVERAKVAFLPLSSWKRYNFDKSVNELETAVDQYQSKYINGNYRPDVIAQYLRTKTLNLILHRYEVFLSGRERRRAEEAAVGVLDSMGDFDDRIKGGGEQSGGAECGVPDHELGKVREEGRDGNVRKVADYIGVAKAWARLCDGAGPRKLTVEDILEVHALILGSRGSTGELRSVDVHAGAHLFPPSSCLERSLPTCVERINAFCNNEDLNPCVAAAYCMYEIIALHPFIDGNGRLARLVAGWCLLSRGCPFPASFGPEDGAMNGHRNLLTAVNRDRSNLGIPSMLATRILLSVYNTFVALESDDH